MGLLKCERAKKGRSQHVAGPTPFTVAMSHPGFNTSLGHTYQGSKSGAEFFAITIPARHSSYISPAAGRRGTWRLAARRGRSNRAYGHGGSTPAFRPRCQK